jgi:RNA recognition motif-containing protein
MAQETFEGNNNTVHVSNISPSATEKTVADFFSFCGKISKLYLHKEQGTAVIQFETESAAKTALLLTNALIVDRPITVTPFAEQGSSPSTESNNNNAAPADFGTQVDPDKITERDFGVPDDQRTKTSVVASLAAAGYVLANDAIDRAKDYDDKHNFSNQAKGAIEQVKVKAQELDQQYKISETAVNLKNTVEQKAKEIDQSYHISEKAQQAANAVKSTATAVVSKIQENSTVSSGIDTLMNTANLVTSTVQNAYLEVKDQTSKAIEEKQRERGKVPNPAAAAAVAETEAAASPSLVDSPIPPTHQQQ